ncbi:MAG: hypothetical protein QXU97_06090 [Fervidicoccaceae archaeon]
MSEKEERKALIRLIASPSSFEIELRVYSSGEGKLLEERSLKSSAHCIVIKAGEARLTLTRPLARVDLTLALEPARGVAEEHGDCVIIS